MLLPLVRLKLCTIADLVPPSSVVVGVDVSQHRISLCKNIIKKYHIDETASTSKPANTQQETLLSPCKNNDSTNTLTSSPTKHDSNLLPEQGGSDIENHSRVTIRLYCADGTTFGVNSLNSNESQSYSEHGLVFDSSIATEELKNRGKRKRLNKSARAREKRRLLELHRQELEGVGVIDDATSEWGKGRENSTSVAETKYVTTEKTEHLNGNHTVVPLFDRVLVDAECSTDGAVRHIQKRSSSSTSPRGPAWDDTNMNELVNLQKRLIESGFNLLRSGGVMVYSTCSLSGAQNEEVVLWLLTKYKDAFVVPVSFKCNTLSRSLDFMAEGSIRGTVRFKPNTNEVREKSELDKCLPEDRIFSGGGFFLAKIGKSLD